MLGKGNKSAREESEEVSKKGQCQRTVGRCWTGNTDRLERWRYQRGLTGGSWWWWASRKSFERCSTAGQVVTGVAAMFHTELNSRSTEGTTGPFGMKNRFTLPTHFIYNALSKCKRILIYRLIFNFVLACTVSHGLKKNRKVRACKWCTNTRKDWFWTGLLVAADAGCT